MPGTLLSALGEGVVPVASRLPVYEEILAEGELGFMFEPGEVQTLAAHLTRLLDEPELLAERTEEVREHAGSAGLAPRGR